MASDYIMDVDVETAMQRHDNKEAIVIPVILNHCEWPHTPLAKLQGLPRDAKPIMTFANQDEAFNNVVVEIRRLIESFAG